MFPQCVNKTCYLPSEMCNTIRLRKFGEFWPSAVCFLQKTTGLGTKLKLR